MHQPFENLSDRQLKKARAQAKSEVPVEKILRHRIRPWAPYELGISSCKSCVCEHDWKSLWQSEEGVGSSLSVIVIRGWKFDWTGCSGHRTLDKCFTASHGMSSSYERCKCTAFANRQAVLVFERGQEHSNGWDRTETSNHVWCLWCVLVGKRVKVAQPQSQGTKRHVQTFWARIQNARYKDNTSCKNGGNDFGVEL